MESHTTLTERFGAYFERETAQRAAKSIADGAQVGLKIQGSGGDVVEELHFIRIAGKNTIRPGAAPNPQVIFTLTPEATEQVLADPSEDIGSIGVSILKLIVSADANRRITVQVKTGFLELFSKGYFGVIATGGQQFAGQLASMGLNGLGAIKELLKNLRS